MWYEDYVSIEGSEFYIIAHMHGSRDDRQLDHLEVYKDENSDNIGDSVSDSFVECVIDIMEYKRV